MKSFDATKKNEFTTYKKLGLSREHKSRKNRRKAEEERIWLYIGGERADRPFLKVLKSDYLRVWDEVNGKMAKEKGLKGLSIEQWADLQKKQIERAVYDVLAAKDQLVIELETSFKKKHGRGMTPHERSIYARAIENSKKENVNIKRRAELLRKSILNNVLKQIERCQRNQSSRLQQAWATVVGTEAAQETLLEKIDEQNGVAVCRCLSSTLAFKLKRDKDLAARFSKELGFIVKKVIFRS